jgi:hypothetical protein
VGRRPPLAWERERPLQPPLHALIASRR